MWVRACVCQNHDFDHGVPALVRLSKACGCPWIISNALDAKSGLPLAGGSEVGVVDHRGLRIGFVGLVEEAWLATLGTVDRDEVRCRTQPPGRKARAARSLATVSAVSQVDYTDFVDAAARLERQLRDDAGCDMVIALCHMRTDNDIRLAKEVRASGACRCVLPLISVCCCVQVPGLDLVLGGHDHDFEVHTVAGTMVLKSGTDFRTLSQVNLVWTPPQAGEARGRVTAEVKR